MIFLQLQFNMKINVKTGITLVHIGRYKSVPKVPKRYKLANVK